MPDSINSCGELKAPPARMTSRRALTRRGVPVAPLAHRRRGRIGPVKMRAVEVLDADRPILLIENDAGGEGMQHDPQPLRMPRGDIENPLAGADALMRGRRQRRIADALEPAAAKAAVVRVGRAKDERAQAAQRMAGGKRRRARRAHHQVHQLVVAQRLPRQRDFAVEPARPAVPGRIDAVPVEEAPERPVAAILQPLPVTPHVGGAP